MHTKETSTTHQLAATTDAPQAVAIALWCNGDYDPDTGAVIVPTPTGPVHANNGDTITLDHNHNFHVHPAA